MKSEVTVDDLKFVEGTLFNIKLKNDQSNSFSMGIFYGLVFGIIGNLFITLFFDYKLKDLADSSKFFLLMAVILVILCMLIIFIIDGKKFKRNNEALGLTTNKIIDLKEKKMHGDKVNWEDVYKIIR